MVGFLVGIVPRPTERFAKSDISAICAEAVKKGGEEEWRDELYQFLSNRSQV